jgi:NAD(P)-dependent dehydrogenase (short-subunit alcohol dehydrogenase family)
MAQADAVPDTTATGLRLDGHVVIVTGASSGLGVQFAGALARAGANVVLAARRVDRLERLAAELATDCLAVRCDVGDEGDRAALVDAAVERFGRLDGLVNNAGAADMGPALQQTTDQFERIVDVNLVAPFVLAREAAKAMRASGGGAIVNIASVAGLIPISWQPHASYVASKTGLVGLTRELASQWGRYAIRVNAIAPGPFTSEMSGESYEDGHPFAEQMKASIPLGRVGRPGEMDGLLLLLLHPSSAYITGQTIAVDGGLTASL